MASDSRALLDQHGTGLPQLPEGTEPSKLLLRQLQGIVARRQAEQRAQQEAVHQARSRYLAKAILVQEVKKAVLNAAPEDKGLQELGTRMQVAESLQRLRIPEPAGASWGSGAHQRGGTPERTTASAVFGGDVVGSGEHWLGVRPEDLMAHCDKSPAATKAMLRSALPVLTASLEQRLHALNDMVQPGASSDEQAHPAEVIAQRQSNIRANTLRAAVALQQQLLATYRAQAKIMGVMNDLCSFMQHDMAEYNRAASNAEADFSYHAVHCLGNKIVQMEKHMLQQIYSAESVKALKQMHAQLTARAQHMDTELNKMRMTLTGYQQLGPEYQQVVASYAQVCTDMRRMQHELNMLTQLHSEVKGADQF